MGPTEALELPTGVLLRKPVADDVPALLAVHGDPAAYELDPQERHLDADHTTRWLVPIIAHWDLHGFGYWTVLVPREWWPKGPPGAVAGDAGRVVAGMGGVRRHHTPHHEVVLNVYFRFAPPTRGRGLAGVVVRQGGAVGADREPGLDLVIRTRPTNAAARRVAEREGFTDHGVDPAEPGMQLLRRSARPTGAVASER